MHREFIERSFAYIEGHLFDELSLEQCAQAAGYSFYHYCRVFQKAMGMTVKEYIRKRRVSEAAKMINETSLSLKEIAFHCGFNSQENFIRVFRSVFGITPTDYKNSKYALLLLEADSSYASQSDSLDFSKFREPELIRIKPFLVVGKSNPTTFHNQQHFRDVPVFWNRFYAEKWYEQIELSDPSLRTDYGVSILKEESQDIYAEDNQRNDLEFNYLTGVRVEGLNGVDPGLDVIEVPGGLYACFSHQSAQAYTLIQTLIDTWCYIDYVWLPRSKYQHRGGIEFNEYQPFKNPFNKKIYIPITQKEGAEL